MCFIQGLGVCICMCTQLFPKGTIQAHPSSSVGTVHLKRHFLIFAFLYRSEEISEGNKVFHCLIELMMLIR